MGLRRDDAVGRGRRSHRTDCSCATYRRGRAFGGPDVPAILLAGVALPLVEGVLMIAGPLLLLRLPRFNDVLDGATFGAASAVTFSGASLIVQSLPTCSARGCGRLVIRCPGWSSSYRSAVLQPVIAAGAIGAAAAAFWLRYRAPITDRHALGLVGVPWSRAAGRRSAAGRCRPGQGTPVAHPGHDRARRRRRRGAASGCAAPSTSACSRSRARSTSSARSRAPTAATPRPSTPSAATAASPFGRCRAARRPKRTAEQAEQAQQ